ncbi:ATP-binding protein [Glycomyces buryatensis]|uniref:Helix-turn-helix domain-containing protein n=1 Tax=Glycomyces buryatensis TaxID=2570927 RepID=A0A4S8QEI8_9ACTN|nr:tetratricopeptide repeat protein [Glycomyces buryatensis]THV41325.1 helix-turn-helix domain-containing protein [Glycomyces buryatensis]
MPDRVFDSRINLRPLRLRAMMSQEELASKSGVGTRTIRDIEAGKVRPQARTLRLLIEALELDEAGLALLTGAPDQVVEAPRAIAPVTLPSSTAGFTGRGNWLSKLDESADSASSPLVVLTGAGGVGKTVLALHWGHRSADRFPGGRLYVDLHGFAPGAAAMEPAEAVRQLLGSLGVEPKRIPADTAAQLGLYRTLIGRERRLLILDNVRDAAQVRPLLPDGAQVHTVVISRRRLVALAASHGAEIIEIGGFDRDEAVALLERRLGPQRLAAEPEPVERILAACVGLPLALAITGAKAATRPDLPLRAIAGELATSRLDALAVDEASVDLRAVFSWSYRSLEPDAARLFRLLAVVPGPDFTAAAVVRLHGGTAAEAGRALRSLVEAHLIEFGRPGRHRFHDLIRLYAAELLEAEAPQPDRDAALDRLLDWYLRGADGCRSALYPAMVGLPLPEGAGERFEPTAAEAALWLEAEWENLIAANEHAATHGRPRFTWLLADALRGYVWLHMLGDDGARMTRAALAAATDSGDPLGLASASIALGCALMRCNRLEEAIDHLRDAAGFARRADWPAGAASAEGNLAIACYHQGRMREGLEHAYAALHAYRAIGERRAESTNLHWLGLFHSLMGELDTGIDYLEQALKLATEAGNDPVRVVVLTHLVEIQVHRGRLDIAAAHLNQAVELERASVSIDKSGDLPGVTARFLLASGRTGEALAHAKRGVERTDDADHRNRAADMVTLAAARDQAGDHEEAIALYDRVLAMTEHDATVFHRVEGMVGRATALLRGGDAARAEDAAKAALRTTRRAGYRFLEGRALNLLAEIDLEAGRLGAAERAGRALLIHRETGYRSGEAVSLHLLAECASAEGDSQADRRLRDEARTVRDDMDAAAAVNLPDHG